MVALFIAERDGPTKDISKRTALIKKKQENKNENHFFQTCAWFVTKMITFF